MSKSNTLLSNEQAIISRLSDQVDLYKNANQYHKEEKNYMTNLWIERGQEIEDLQKENARLSQRLKLATAERNTARDAAERNMKWLQERNEEVDQLKQRIAELEK